MRRRRPRRRRLSNYQRGANKSFNAPVSPSPFLSSAVMGPEAAVPTYFLFSLIFLEISNDDVAPSTPFTFITRPTPVRMEICSLH